MSRARDVASGNLALINPTSDGNLLTASSGAWVSQAPAPAPPDVAGNIVQLTANGSIADGKPVILETAGTVAQVATSSTALGGVLQNNQWAPAHNQNFGWPQMFYNPVEDMVCVVYRDESNNDYITAVMGQISNKTASGITWGTPVVIDTVAGYWVAGACQESNGRMMVFWQDTPSNLTGKCAGFVRSGTLSITVGSITTYDVTAVQYNHACYDSTNDAIVLGYRQYPANGGTTYRPHMMYFQVYANLVTNFISNTLQVANLSTEYNRVAYSPDHQRVMMTYCDSGAGNHWKCSTVSYNSSGTSLHTGSTTTIASVNAVSGCVAYDESADKFITFYRDASNSTGTAHVLTLTAGGTNASPSDSVSVATKVDFLPANVEPTQIEATYWPSQNKVVFTYERITGNTNAVANTASISGTSITYGTEVYLADSSGSPSFTSGDWNMICHDPDNDTIVISWRGYAPSSSPNRFALTSLLSFVPVTNLTGSNFLGIASGAVTNGQTATIQLTGNVDDAQTGLTINATYYVQDDGTLSTATGQNVVAGRALSATELKIA